MPSIVAYRKATDDYTTYTAHLPEAAEELATLDGVTYVSLPDGATMPVDQPPEIQITTPTISARLRKTLEYASPHATAARRVADADVAAGRKTRAQADADVLQRLSGLGLVLTALADIKSARIVEINAECTQRIIAVWSLEKQLSAMANIYGSAELTAMTAWVDAHIAASNTASDAVDAAATTAEVEAVTVAWPV